MRKKHRLEKKRRKRVERAWRRLLRKMKQRGTLHRLSNLIAAYIPEKMKQQSFTTMLFAPLRTPEPPFEAAVVDDTNVIHWSTLVPKRDAPRETWSRVTLCDVNRDLEQGGCSLTQAMPTCVECIAREGA